MKNFKKDSAGGEAAGQKREGKGSEKNKLPITKPSANPVRGILISDGKTLSLRPVSQDVKNAEKAQKVVYL